MEMQDNEFDELFRTKLDGFEAEPSAGVWARIIAELNGRGRKKALIPILSIAASIIVLVAAGILFVPQRHPVNDKNPAKNRIAKTTPGSIVNNHQKPAAVKPTAATGATVAPNPAKLIAVRHQTKAIKHINANEAMPAINQSPPDKSNGQSLIAALPQGRGDNIKAVVPDETIQLALKQNVDQLPTFKTKPMLLASQSPAINSDDTIPVKVRHKIHGLGGLLNAVVAKVDKRSDKFIHFGDSDDDESNITSVNLGIIKIKKAE
jgi:hypothetical protein